MAQFNDRQLRFHGFKTAGSWFTVPDNTKWHTVKWTIDDAQFVNYWGYNFALDSDGNQFNSPQRCGDITSNVAQT
jgi:hypothetical protein